MVTPVMVDSLLQKKVALERLNRRSEGYSQMHTYSLNVQLVDGVAQPAILQKDTVAKYLLDGRIYQVLKAHEGAAFRLEMLRERIGQVVGAETAAELVQFLVEEKIVVDARQAQTARDFIKEYFARRRMQILTLEITNKCNFICPHCSRNCSPSNNRLLKRDTVLGLLRWAKKSDMRQVFVTGGEPLLHPDIGDLLREIRILELDVNLVSNVSLIHQIDMDVLRTARSLNFSASFYGDDNYYRRYSLNAVSRHMIEENILRLSEAIGDRLTVTTPVMGCNEPHFESIVKFCRKHRLRFTASFCAPFGRGLSGWQSNQVDFRALLRNRNYRRYFFTNQSRGATDSAFHFPCSLNNLCVLSDYTITNCINMPDARLAIYDDNKPPEQIAEIFNGLRFVKAQLRFAVDKRKFCRVCEYKFDCGGGCPARAKSYYGSIDYPDPFCLYHRNISAKCGMLPRAENVE
jgi:radical SAM protein with 4Fe4S-binding SPASM domain